MFDKFVSRKKNIDDSEKAEIVLSKKTRLSVCLVSNDAGRCFYVFRNEENSQEFQIEYDLFDAFRRALAEALRRGKESDAWYLSFLGSSKAKFEFEKVNKSERVLHIIDLDSRESRSRLSLSEDLIADFLAALFDARLFRPSGVLDRVIAYHKLLQLSFPNVAESMNATMTFRADFLTLDIDLPKIELNKDDLQSNFGSLPSESLRLSGATPAVQVKTHSGATDFVSRLGIKRKGTHTVSYDDFLSQIIQRKIDADARPGHSTEKKSSRDDQMPGVIDLGLSGLDLKSFSGGTIRVRPDEYDLQRLRDFCGSQRDNWKFFLGFEIVDCWYKDRTKKIRCKRFPLYFSEVTLADYGSEVEISFVGQASFYLNHLALSSLILNFSEQARASELFQKTLERLLHCRFDWNSMTERVCIERKFPVAESFCKEQRRIVFGQEFAGPPAGLLENLKIIHVAFDPDQTLFFPRNSQDLATSLALSRDLDAIQLKCQAGSDNYYSSLFGRIFSPSRQTKTALRETNQKVKHRDSAVSFNPFPLPHSSLKIFDEIQKRDILLVEGPPGTGKTHSMLGLIVHAVCQGQKILVVSDKMSALEAVYEKMGAFVLEGARDEAEIAAREFALRCGVKRVHLSEKANQSIQEAARELKACLKLELLHKNVPVVVADSAEVVEEKIKAIDLLIRHELLELDRLLAAYFDRGPRFSRVCPRNWRETTDQDVADLGAFAKYLLVSPDVEKSELHRILKNFVVARTQFMSRVYAPLAHEFCPAEADQSSAHMKKLTIVRERLALILEAKPRDESAMHRLIEPLLGGAWYGFLMRCYLNAFGPDDIQNRSGLTRIKDRLFYPLAEDLQNLMALIDDELKLYSLKRLVDRSFVSQLRKLHLFLVGYADQEYCMVWNILQTVIYGHETAAISGVAHYLSRIKSLQEQRSDIVRRCYVNELLRPLQRVSASPLHGGQFYSVKLHDVAQLDSHFEAAIQAENSTNAWQNFETAKAPLHDLFHVWLVKKDCVSLALKNESEMFDLVIIDEATQCRVDDAVPLLFRSKRIVAVGDDKQTTLQRESLLDDYLFQSLDLEEHLQTLNATGIKSAGSHVFALIKGLKQSYVMLDEHYRCPPEIIEYSNHYVYGDQLKIMKWRPKNEAAAVVVDYAERRSRLRNRPNSGKYKGIEMGMIDRFFNFMEREIINFEKETGRRVNLESDVAICYFLLKNAEYVKEQKQKFLARMKRGNDVLDGAGAALQGKERDLVFFLWDITRANFAAFAQGDDPLKRKGEINVLMSRPRLRAYHYLHKDFSQLPHEKASITSYLWDVWNRSNAKPAKSQSVDDGSILGKRLTLPSPFRLPWRRTDGQLLHRILESFAAHLGVSADFKKFDAEFGVPIGTLERRVDLILSPRKNSSQKRRLAFVDIIGFDAHSNAASLLEYYEALLRAQPAVTPIFLNIHELFAPGSATLTFIFSHISEEFSRKTRTLIS